LIPRNHYNQPVLHIQLGVGRLEVRVSSSNLGVSGVGFLGIRMQVRLFENTIIGVE
jgi:hypothetical protein